MPGKSFDFGFPIKVTFAIAYVALMTLAVVGCKRIRDDRSLLMLAILPAAYLTLLHVVFVSSIRYREPAMIMLVIPAAILLAQIAGRIHRRN